MAELYFPFDAGPGSVVTEDYWGRMARGWLSSGVMPGELGGLKVTADGSSRAVQLATGRGWVRGFYYENDASLTIPVAAAHPTLPRIDAVVIRLDTAANTVLATVIQGSPAASPSAPALVNTATQFDVLLALVSVPAAATVITLANVTDRRVFAAGGGKMFRRSPNSVEAITQWATEEGVNLLEITPEGWLRGTSSVAPVSVASVEAGPIITFREPALDDVIAQVNSAGDYVSRDRILPRGQLVQAQRTTNVATINATVQTVVTAQVPAGAAVAPGRRLGVHLGIPSILATSGGTHFIVNLTRNGTSVCQRYLVAISGSVEAPGLDLWKFLTAATATDTFAATIARSNSTGTGTLTASAAQPIELTVFDAGL